MRAHVDQRQAQVRALVRARGSVRVTDLARELGISPVTLRRDIEAMAARGEIHRMHGMISRVEQSPAPTGRREGLREGRREGLAAAGGEGWVVGMVVPTTEYYYADVVRGAREVVEARGARLTVGLTRYLPGEDRTQADRLLSTGADGLLLTPNWDTGSAGPGEGAWTAELPVPTVLVERWAPPGHPAAALDRVVSDHAHGAARAVRHLVDSGHRRIALACQETPTTARLRAGYEAAVSALGLEPAPPWPPAASDPLSVADRFARALDYLYEAVTTRGVTAALIHSDTDAIMLIPRLQARGVRVPEDLAVITYDDEVAGLADVPLTAVAPAKREVGARAAGLLLDRLAFGAAGGVRGTGADLGAGAGAGVIVGAGVGVGAGGADGAEEAPRQHLELLPRLTIRP
ncbi:substrate-binding domain-containing protein [Streptomyces sp. NPDC102278]|uniref:substrate-binding domain-containing protein n=1 Tax=Streptomyces sp. NPDC102278 TaxID=3366152 RepID=UPI00382A9726